MNTILAFWQDYDRRVVPPNAPMVQREECRRAFYAGARAAFSAMMKAIEPDDPDACEANLQALNDEIDGIALDMRGEKVD